MKKWSSRLIRGNDKKIEKNSFLWNMIFSVLLSLQSTIIIMLVTRVTGTDDAGIISIAFAIGYLMFTLGLYGVRNFQVTSVQENYTYGDYRIVRIMTCTSAVLFTVIYCFLQIDEKRKALCILFVCILKIIDAVEDLYHGELQRRGRLDIAGKLGTVRLIVFFAILFCVLIVTKDVLLALIVSVFPSIVIVLAERYVLRDIFGQSLQKSTNSWRGILQVCFPLFLMSFLSIYISNASKYAIDIYMTEEVQAYFAMIFTPVFTINLLSEMIYRPQLVKISKVWNQKESKEFRKIVRKQIVSIVVISLIIFIGGVTIGIRLLEILYGLPLVHLIKEFAILLIGGGLVAIFNFLLACLTIMRKQRVMLGISLLLTLEAVVLSNYLVSRAGIEGASWLYMILMLSGVLMASVMMIKFRFAKEEE